MGHNTQSRKRTKSRRRKSKRKVHQNRSRSKRRRKGTRKRRRGGTTPAIRRAERWRARNTDRTKQMAKFTARYNAVRDLPHGHEPVGAPPRPIAAMDADNRQRFKNAMTISNHLIKSQYKEDMGNDAERDLVRMSGVPPRAARTLRDMNYGPSRAARGTMAVAHAGQ
jgi:hypothetical protein